MRRSILGLLIVILAACQPNASTPTAIPFTPAPRIVHHPPPVIPEMNLEAFEKASVVENNPDLFYTSGSIPDSPLAALGCQEIARPSDPLGALTPAYPVAICRTRERGLYSSGCMMPVNMRYVIFHEKQFEVIESLDEFQAFFAPIESASEALSYALATTGLSAVYGMQLPPGYSALTDTLEDTHVTDVETGYQINLYKSWHCGCGPEAMDMTTVLVTRAGAVTTLSQARVYEDASGNILCVD
jgi:hypothetical protein